MKKFPYPHLFLGAGIVAVLLVVYLIPYALLGEGSIDEDQKNLAIGIIFIISLLEGINMGVLYHPNRKMAGLLIGLVVTGVLMAVPSPYLHISTFSEYFVYIIAPLSVGSFVVGTLAERKEHHHKNNPKPPQSKKTLSGEKFDESYHYADMFTSSSDSEGSGDSGGDSGGDGGE